MPGGGGAPVKVTGSSRLRTRPRYFMRAVSSWPTKQPLAKSTPFSSSKPLSSSVDFSTTRSRLPSGTPSVSRSRSYASRSTAWKPSAASVALARVLGQQGARTQAGARRGSTNTSPLLQRPRGARQLRQIERPGHVVADQGRDGEARAAVLDLDLGAQAVHQEPPVQLAQGAPRSVSSSS